MIRMSQVMAVVVALTLTAYAQNENSLTRDEVGVIKKKLVAVLGAIGAPPEGYTKTEESYSLPTEASKTNGGGYYPVNASAHFEFGSSAEKKAKKSSEELQKEYEKKMMEAQAKGDYQTMTQLGQEMSKKASQAQMEASEGRKEPISVQIQFNSNPGQTIDPDGVVFDSPGVIALKFADDVDGTKGRVAIYYDPVNLKESKTVSSVDMKMPEKGVAKRTTVLNVTVQLSGPLPEATAWAKRIANSKVTAQID